MADKYVVNKHGEAFGVAGWVGVFGDEIPQDVIDALPVGRIETLERIRWVKKVTG